MELEFGEWYDYQVLNDLDYDVVIFVGDIQVFGVFGVQWVVNFMIFGGWFVIYVFGNYEFYGYVFEFQLNVMLCEGKDCIVCVLYCSVVVIGGVCFFGVVLWMDFSLLVGVDG